MRCSSDAPACTTLLSVGGSLKKIVHAAKPSVRRALTCPHPRHAAVAAPAEEPMYAAMQGFLCQVMLHESILDFSTTSEMACDKPACQPTGVQKSAERQAHLHTGCVPGGLSIRTSSSPSITLSMTHTLLDPAHTIPCSCRKPALRASWLLLM